MELFWWLAMKSLIAINNAPFRHAVRTDRSFWLAKNLVKTLVKASGRRIVSGNDFVATAQICCLALRYCQPHTWPACEKRLTDEDRTVF